MAFIIAAGFVPSRTPVLSSTSTSAARAHPAPEMQQMATRQGYDCLLSSISSSICDNATRLHGLDFERLGRRAEKTCQFQDRLSALKDRVARIADARPRSAYEHRSFELACKAS
jgi:hypothetical protein